MSENAGAAAPADRGDRIAAEAARIGHDLNNCLGVVGGRAELLRMHAERGDSAGIRKGVEAILGQVDRMKLLSDELRGLRERG